ncbi:MAG: hypothetical protein M3168_05095, partial [Actinomycetota bacterium]|nr:hypothetical protein [Actinomycetota bacterium]
MIAVVRGRGLAETEAGGRLQRLVAAVPILTVFAWFFLLYAWQAWLVGTPTIFVDELRYTQIARSVAEGGDVVRRGYPAGLDTLAEVLTAPAWLRDDVHAAYDFAKYIGVAAMSATVFPAYGLARMLVSPRWALFAAAASVAVPALVYSSLLLEEPFAYPVATLAFYLIVRAVARREPGAYGAAAAVSLIAPFVRGELALVPAIFLSVVGVVAWGSPRVRGWRAGWTGWDKVGAAILAIGLVIVLNSLFAHLSFTWERATGDYKGRMIEYGLWAGGAFTIGIGIVPAIIGLALLARPPGEPRTPERTAFTALLGLSVFFFGLYTAAKAAHLSTVFGTRVAERNLIYLVPLLFVATAIWLERPRLRGYALTLAAAFVLLMLEVTPIVLEFPYFEAPGYSILVAANRDLSLAAGTIDTLVLVGFAAALGLIVLASFLRAASHALPAVVAVAVLAVNATGVLYALYGSRQAADAFLANFPDPPDWIDEATGGAETLYLGKRIIDPNGVNLLEFWNRSIRHVWSVEGSAPGPGRTVTPDLATAEGELFPDPGVPYVVADPGIDVVGEVVARGGNWRLFRVDPPLRLVDRTADVYTDDWMGESSSYSRFATPDNRPGTMHVTVSRAGWGGTDVPGKVTIRLGTLVIGDDKQPAMGRVTAVRRWEIHSRQGKTFTIPTPRPPFHVVVEISPTFVPAELDPSSSSDRRELGAQVAYRFV